MELAVNVTQEFEAFTGLFVNELSLNYKCILFPHEKMGILPIVIMLVIIKSILGS